MYELYLRANMKKIGLIITILMFYCLFIGYGIVGVSDVYSQNPLKGVVLIIILLIGLALWTKISLRLIKEIRRKA